MVTSMNDRPKKPSKSSSTTRRAIPLPDDRSIINMDNSATTGADTKKNKLGYQRTAIACGHCRRRKIRCIKSPDPNTTKCHNCIRLKKDCQYLPVDPAAMADTKRTRSNMKGDVLAGGSETSVSSSSPSAQIGPTIDHFDRYSTDLNPPVSHGGVDYSNIPGSSNIGGPPEHGFGFQQPFEQPSWAQPGTVNPSPRFPSESQQDNKYRDYWQPQEQSQHVSFAPSPYSLAVASNIPTSSHEQSFSFSTPSLGQPGYHYPSRVPREADGSSNDATPFGMYRANTMPTLDRSSHSMNISSEPSALTSQQILSPAFSGAPHSSPYHTAPELSSNWSPQGHLQSSYMSSGAGNPWYNSQLGLNEIREEEDRTQAMLSHRKASGQSRPKPR